MGCETLDLLKSLAPWAAIVVSVIILYFQLKRSRFSQSVDLILKLEQRFNKDKDVIEARRKAAKAFHSNSGSPPSDIEDVLDFFETLGLLVRRKALDKEMVWHTFYYWMHRYWLLSKAYIREKQKSKPTFWKDYVRLEEQLTAIERKKSKLNTDIDLSKDELDVFLNDECNL
jgi:hypothetical protein